MEKRRNVPLSPPCVNSFHRENKKIFPFTFAIFSLFFCLKTQAVLLIKIECPSKSRNHRRKSCWSRVNKN